MAAGTMKAKYWLVTAAAVAAAGVTVYTRLSASDPPLPKVPMTAEARPETPRLKLPPVVTPPDEPAPVVPDTGSAPPPLPLPVPKLSEPPALPPVTPTSGIVPLVPVVPPVPALPTSPGPVAPAVPTVPTPPKAPPVPVYPAPISDWADEPPAPKPPVAAPTVPAPIVPMVPTPITPVAPTIPAPMVPAKPELPLPAPEPPTPVAPPVKPQPLPSLPPAPPVVAPSAPLPAPTPVLQPPVSPMPTKVDPHAALSVVGKFVVLKEDKLIVGDVSVNNDTVIVRQGALDRPFPKSQVQFVATSRDEVYKFMLAKVAANDAAARLQVARWCMFSGLREQALTEAREVQKLAPGNRNTADLVRSLELSLQQFPAEDSPKMTAPGVPTFPAELTPPPAKPVVPIPPAVDPEPDVSPEAALVFGARVQPFLANQCTDCHAKPDHAGKFKLVRVNPAEAGPQATRTNLRAVAGQLKKDDPGISPLLLKSLVAHGGQKLPSATRQSLAYQSLEAWTALAVGTPLTVQQPLPAPVAPAPTTPASPVAPAAPQPVPPIAEPVLPLPPTRPEPPAVDPAPVPLPLPLPNPPVADPLLPPAPAMPVAPLPKPVLPPTEPLGPSLPTAPPVLAPVPTVPVFPPPDAGTKPAPVIPPIPPAVSTTPKSPVVPATGSQFGVTAPPKPPTTGPAGDEFDPAGFNQQPRK